LNSRLRPWLVRLLEMVLDRFLGPQPLVVRNSVDRQRRLQRRATRQALRTPLEQPRRRVAPQIDRGFQ